MNLAPIDRRNALRLAAGASLLPFAGAQPALAAPGRAVVVELFTSQGCSSCPEADAYFADLAQRGDVIALSYHVDYWDYLGWRDTLASADFARRQQDYAARRGDGRVYTPQVVIDGTLAEVGSRRSAVEALIAQQSARVSAEAVRMSVSASPHMLAIALGPEVAPRKASVWIAAVEPRVAVTITRGENAGREMVYHNVVRRLVPAGKWDGASATIELPRSTVLAPSASAFAVLLQADDTGEILAARWQQNLGL
jgi:hypothetical protein